MVEIKECQAEADRHGVEIDINAFQAQHGGWTVRRHFVNVSRDGRYAGMFDADGQGAETTIIAKDIRDLCALVGIR